MTNNHEHYIRETDYLEGLDNERKIFDKLQNMGYNVEPTHRYKYYDFLIDKKYVCEVKHRNVKKDRYHTTILPFSKIKQYKLEHKKYKDLIMIFSFEDGNYFTTYYDLCKNKHKVKIAPFTRYTGFTHTTRPHVFIPTYLLQPLSQIKLQV